MSTVFHLYPEKNPFQEKVNQFFIYVFGTCNKICNFVKIKISYAARTQLNDYLSTAFVPRITADSSIAKLMYQPTLQPLFSSDVTQLIMNVVFHPYIHTLWYSHTYSSIGLWWECVYADRNVLLYFGDVILSSKAILLRWMLFFSGEYGMSSKDIMFAGKKACVYQETEPTTIIYCV